MQGRSRKNRGSRWIVGFFGRNDADAAIVCALMALLDRLRDQPSQSPSFFKGPGAAVSQSVSNRFAIVAGVPDILLGRRAAQLRGGNPALIPAPEQRRD